MIHNEATAVAWVREQPECDDLAFERLEQLVRMLNDENTRQNLVAHSTLQSVWQRHIADSAQLIRHVPRETSNHWLDLGTGAGFPGLVAAILRSQTKVVLVESRKRRVAWLEHACEVLGLTNCQVVGARLEDVNSEIFDCISARAFAPLDALLGLSVRFSTSRTIWLLPKGRSAAQELSELRGWQHRFHVEQSLTDPNAGIVVGQLAGQKGFEP